MQQPFRMPPMGPGQQRPVGPGKPRPTGPLTDVGQRRRPRPTHMWDPERGVIPIDPNAPARFVPPPPPEVIQAYMQGMARRQGVARDVTDDPMGAPIPNARQLALKDPNTGLPMQMQARGPLGLDNEMRHFWPSPENVPIPIPTTGWQDPRLRRLPGQGSF